MLNAASWTRFRHDPLEPTDTFLPLFGAERRLAFARLGLLPGERLLMLGTGIAADLAFVPDTVRGVAAEIGNNAPAASPRHPRIEPRAVDPHRLDLDDGSFDAITLHRALELVADPARCLAEAARVLRDGGRISVLDSFLPPGFRPPLWHRVATTRGAVFFSTADRSFEEILEQSGAELETVVDETSAPPNPNRRLLLRKPSVIRSHAPKVRPMTVPTTETAAMPA